MCMARNIPDACSSLKSNKWERSRLVGVEVQGKTLGIIGLGKGNQKSYRKQRILMQKHANMLLNSWLDRGSPGQRVGHERQRR